ncbi:MAG: UDP-N-acetylmuramoyl-L-alanyl-D-glutamate--2,6-diaminopimelate ligase [Betaproteobacteria bacterium]|jgi:UDP-N-acetylmuramoyl-L-alanyl-D-glutamate--2,6-diaminopimelate ligase
MQHLGSSAAAAAWLTALGARALRTDHRQVRPGDAFMAWPGRSHDARLHASSALAAGAAACLMEARGLDQVLAQAEDERLACLDDLKREAGAVADAFLGHPSRALDVVAVTGTNGKTSCTWWVAQALATLGRGCGVVGTLGVGEPRTALEPTGLTTPDAVALQTAFRRFADGGLSACAIEASSIGIVEHRLAGTALAVAAFTNLTQDHLDYHGTMAAYGAAKRALFDTVGLKAAVLNVGDVHGQAWAGGLAGHPGLDLWTVAVAATDERAPDGSAAHARLQAHEVRQTPEGLAFELCERGLPGQPLQGHAVRTPLIGAFNVENLLVVAGCLRALGVPLADVAHALGLLTPVPGRLQRVDAVGAAAQPAVVVDYAHTPDALDKALQALAPLAAARGGQLWCVFGCGGDRDPGKRPLMGQAAVHGAAHVVVTSDNPRSEAPARILAQVMAGARQAAARLPVPEASPAAGQPAAERADSTKQRCLIAIEDRRAALVYAVRGATLADVVLIAGKGHEQTQEIAGVKHPFSDVAEGLAALALRSDDANVSGQPGPRVRSTAAESRP